MFDLAGLILSGVTNGRFARGLANFLIEMLSSAQFDFQDAGYVLKPELAAETLQNVLVKHQYPRPLVVNDGVGCCI